MCSSHFARLKWLSVLFALVAVVGCGDVGASGSGNIVKSPVEHNASQPEGTDGASAGGVGSRCDPPNGSALALPGVVAERCLTRADLNSLSTDKTWQQIEASFGSGIHIEGGVLAYPVADVPGTFLFWFRHADAGERPLAFVTLELERDPLKELRGLVVWPSGFENQTIDQAFKRVQ